MADQPISLDQFRKKKAEQEAEYKNRPWEGTLVWLFCPTCDLLEYTEIVAKKGRTHKCGTQVVERPVDLDLRAELTISLANLVRLEQLLTETGKTRLKKLLSRAMEKSLKQVKAVELTYIDRLHKAAGIGLTPYEGEMEDLAAKLPIAEKNPLGLWVSQFRYQPDHRFKTPKPT
ncbi:MAG: hypothetical protein A2508_07075 [Candidatus Lambdaproteobacteria bacterium RIFOXYD12_FULL_49_8]|uniref:Uncharacterized protein n=1 Tax=Candidatus Lambdaproteobacteria bacterium RIFOXYD2_FULL_50_16 TaxID=1817772 RepID=A0A1F6GFY3_9PROT|nr:MAG: hypothetical protein A2527_02885 [Candidatus Lambdaproteobacteria bacterium RIFOXYD2_FULL_50_16]OGG97434.1 MAG: hypothetical protein A2508_07075 [Candidatus Lambdaproteobacteria bacterium RIFOXYD12_FULL_49_8]